MTVSTLRWQLLIFSVVASLPGVALATGPLNLDASGVAINGHDPVAYFVDGKAVTGRADYSATAQGATYWFATEANLMAFKADPAKYEPQFGSYCAYGVAKDFKPDIDPNALRHRLQRRPMWSGRCATTRSARVMHCA